MPMVIRYLSPILALLIAVAVSGEEPRAADEGEFRFTDVAVWLRRDPWLVALLGGRNVLSP